MHIVQFIRFNLSSISYLFELFLCPDFAYTHIREEKTGRQIMFHVFVFDFEKEKHVKRRKMNKKLNFDFFLSLTTKTRLR